MLNHRPQIDTPVGTSEYVLLLLASYFSQILLQGLIKSFHHSVWLWVKRCCSSLLNTDTLHISLKTADSKFLPWSECGSIATRIGIPRCSLKRLLWCAPLDWVWHILPTICWNRPSRAHTGFRHCWQEKALLSARKVLPSYIVATDLDFFLLDLYLQCTGYNLLSSTLLLADIQLNKELFQLF